MTSVRKHSAHKITHRVFILCLVIVLLLVGVNSLIISRLRTPLPELKPSTVYAAAPMTYHTLPVHWPTSGQAAIGIDGYDVLANSGAQTPTPTASVAKLITALAVLKAKPITTGSQGAILTLSQNDVNYYNTYSSEDGSVALVTAGEQISEYQVLQGMLLPSANNLADSLAVWAFGSLAAYNAYANQMLHSLGLTHTHVGSDASGFQPDTTSTASDLVHLGEIAYADPVIAGIAAQSTANIPVAGTVKNVNWLLGTAGINGLKTGNNNQDTGAFLFSAPYRLPGGPQVTIIGAIMDESSLPAALDSAVPLLTSTQEALNYSPALVAGQAVGQYNVPWKGEVTAITTHTVNELTWQGQALGKPVIALSNIDPSKDNNTVVGNVSYAYNNATISSSPIRLVQSIGKPSLWWRLLHN